MLYCGPSTMCDFATLRARSLNFNQKPTPVARDPPEPHAKIPLNEFGDWWWLCLYPLVSPPDCARSLLRCLCHLQSLCHELSSKVNHKTTARRQFLPSPPLTGSHTWCPVPPWFRVVRGQSLLPHSMGREQGWDHLRANPGFGVFWFIPPLLSKPIFGQPPL